MKCLHCDHTELIFLGEYYDSNYWCPNCGSLNCLTFQHTEYGSDLEQIVHIPGRIEKTTVK